MRHHLPHILLLLSLLQAGNLCAQRQWGVHDSTHYSVGGDTTLIASRHMLYRALPGDTILLRDFTDPTEPNYFIRDVDHWSANEIYVVFGSRYIGHSTTLFKSTDAGDTWAVDTSFFPAATEPPSINQMAIVADTAYLFNGYYASEVLRSSDRGITWHFWFNSLIAHYYGIHHCEGSAYIYGMEGDGFSPCMWLVPDSLWGMQVNGFYSGCHQGLPAPGIHYASNDLHFAEVVHYFDSLATVLCATGLSVNGSSLLQGITPAPNPASDRVVLNGLPADAALSVFDIRGQQMPVRRNRDSIWIGHLPPGVYFVRISSHARSIIVPLIRE